MDDDGNWTRERRLEIRAESGFGYSAACKARAINEAVTRAGRSISYDIDVPGWRQPDGTLQEASWPAAIQAVARGLTGVRDAHGSDALGFISSSRCTGEENYLMQKLARAAFGTNNCHQCAAT